LGQVNEHGESAEIRWWAPSGYHIHQAPAVSIARLFNLWVSWYLENDGLCVDFSRDELTELPPRLLKLGRLRRVTPTKKSYLQNVVAVVDCTFSARNTRVPGKRFDCDDPLETLTRGQENEIRVEKTDAWIEIRRVIIGE
jgi:hypothetical protein